MAVAYLALGSNLGNRSRYIRLAIQELQGHGVDVLKKASVIETDPVGGPQQGRYLNTVVKIRTSLSAEDLLVTINKIEARLGRIREVKNGPRVIDIDILLYEHIKLVSRRLIIPHPRMWERDFVMKPLKEICPDICAS